MKLAALFSDNMVLQRERPVPVWGWSSPGDAIAVSFAGQTHTATAGADALWMAALDPLPASDQSGILTAESKSSGTKLEVRNILIGDVWLCSGQSNMEWPVGLATNSDAEIAAAEHPRIRLCSVAKVMAESPQAEVAADWKVCSPASVAVFSAVGYFFGRELQHATGVPIGLIHASWGGTRIEAWTSRPALESDAECDENGMAGLYNGMIAPLAPAALQGAIWYQGESNVENADRYRRLFPLMIGDWRRTFCHETLPFFFVQLANFMAPQKNPTQSGWAELRDAQTATLDVPHTGMAVAIDIGEADDIHPTNKQEVGRRLALSALAQVYGLPLAGSGPLYRSHEIEGGAIRVHFRHAEGGLKTSDGASPKTFAIAGGDGTFEWADAVIDGETVVVRSDLVSEPVSVSYAWANNPPANLCGTSGLPASPFRER